MTTGLSLLERIRQRGVFELVTDIAHDHGQLLTMVLGKSRKRPVVAARRAVIVALRERGLSLPEIGALIGRDHTSVLHHLRVAERDRGGMEAAE